MLSKYLGMQMIAGLAGAVCVGAVILNAVALSHSATSTDANTAKSGLDLGRILVMLQNPKLRLYVLFQVVMGVAIAIYYAQFSYIAASDFGADASTLAFMQALGAVIGVYFCANTRLSFPCSRWCACGCACVRAWRRCRDESVRRQHAAARWRQALLAACVCSVCRVIHGVLVLQRTCPPVRARRTVWRGVSAVVHGHDQLGTRAVCLFVGMGAAFAHTDGDDTWQVTNLKASGGDEDLGTAIGFVHATRSFCGIVAPVISGYLLKFYGRQVLGFTSTSLALLSLVVLSNIVVAADAPRAHAE